MSDFIAFTPGKEIEWLEINLLKTEQPISKSLILNLTEQEEQDVDSWLSEIEHRNNLFDIPYYTITGNRISANVSYKDVPEYFLCLYFSYYGAANNKLGTKLFEKISAIALKNFLGGEIYALGFPENKSFNDHLSEISNVCNEERGMNADHEYKDDGVDVICYKNFGDNRSSNLYVLLQCAAGIHWNSKKSIAVERWKQYILWFYSNIITSLSTTDYLTGHRWKDGTGTYGMILDRMRINNYYYKSIDPTIHAETLDWYNTIDF